MTTLLLLLKNWYYLVITFLLIVVICLMMRINSLDDDVHKAETKLKESIVQCESDKTKLQLDSQKVIINQQEKIKTLSDEINTVGEKYAQLSNRSTKEKNEVYKELQTLSSSSDDKCVVLNPNQLLVINEYIKTSNDSWGSSDQSVTKDSSASP